MKTFLSRFGWVERKENKWWNPDVFSSDPPKSFLLKIERKLLSIIFGRKCSCTIAHGLHPRYFSSHLIFFPPRLCLFFFFFFPWTASSFFSFFLFFFFNLFGRLVQYSFFSYLVWALPSSSTSFFLFFGISSALPSPSSSSSSFPFSLFN